MNRTRLRTLALVTGLAIALPLAGGAVMAWGLMDRSERVSDIPVAIVNNDQIITGDRPMAAGRALTDALVHPDDEATELGWIVTDEQDAAEGFDSGEYLAVLTIPDEFSASVLSASGNAPVATELTLETDPATSASAALASRVVAQTAADTLGRQITTAFLTTTINGVDDLSRALADAADGADQLADGAARVNDGAEQANTGTTQLADALKQLNAGASEVAAGNGRLVTGAATLSGGAVELSEGAAAVASGAAQVSAATAATATGSQQLADALADLASSCPLTAPQQYCAAVAGAAQSADALASSSNQVAAGAVATATGAETLSASSTTYAQAAAGLVTGAQTAASGANELANATKGAATGANALSAGSAELATGAGELSTGAEELAAGLGEGADAAPTYTQDEIDQLAEVVTQPVTVSSTAIGAASGWLPAVIAAVVLWLAAIATITMGIRATSVVELLSPASNWRLTLAVLRRRMAIAATQGLVVALIIGACGFDLASGVLFGALAVLGAMTFTAILIGLQVMLGRWGIAAFAVLTMLQVSTLSAALPIQTAPPWIAAVDPYLPLSAFTNLAAQLAGSTPGVESVTPFLCLVAWAAVGVAFVFVGVRRRRTVRMASTAESRRLRQSPERMWV